MPRSYELTTAADMIDEIHGPVEFEVDRALWAWSAARVMRRAYGETVNRGIVSKELAEANENEPREGMGYER